MAAEMNHAAKDLQENFLHHVTGVAGIAQQAQRQIVDRLLEPGQQRLVGLFGTRAQTGDQFQVFGDSSLMLESLRVKVEQQRASH